MDKIIIKSSDVGQEYLDELNAVMKIRRSRRKIWKDSFFDEKVEDLVLMGEGKIRRWKNSNDFNSQVDSLRDAINYLFFALINFQKRKKK